MNEQDFDNFCAMFDAAYEAKGKALSAGTKALFFGALAPYDLADVSRGLIAHLRDPEKGEWAPMPANVIAQIEAAKGGDGRPAPDEAWAIALRGFDEADTVVWTAEIQRALEVARPILGRRDSVGARKAFLDAYERLVGEARQRGEIAAWTLSLGTDPARREGEIQRTAAAGLLPAPTVAAYLPAPAGAAYPEGLAKVKEAIAQLIPADVKLAQLRAAELERERAAVAAKKGEIAAQVREQKKVEANGTGAASLRGPARSGVAGEG